MTGLGARGRQHTLRASDDGEEWPTLGRDFVPVELLGPIHAPTEPTIEPPTNTGIETPAPLMATDPDESWVDRTSLFGDLEA